MSKFQHNVILRVVKLLNVLLISAPFAGVWYLYNQYKLQLSFSLREKLAILIAYAVIYVLIGKAYDAFLVSMQRVSELVYSQILAAILANALWYIVVCHLTKRLCGLLPSIAVIAGQFLMSILWSILAHRWYYSFFPAQKTAVLYDVRQGLETLISEYGMSLKYNVELVLNIQECLSDLSVLDSIDTVFLSGIHSHDRNTVLKYCISKNINVFVIPRVGDVIMSGARPMHRFHLPMLYVKRHMASIEYLFIKRVMDIVLSLVAFILFSPIFLVTAIAIKVTDGGPVFYKQVRLTKDGKTFEILKFRSMRVDAEKDGIARLSTGDKDVRITKVGRIIRKYRIDELPQLLNILKGDLSICGPRPERPEIAEQYCEEIPEFKLRLQAKAGLTGYAQVYGKYNITPYDKLLMDLMYIAQPSLLQDLKIILMTVKILFVPESTEGIAEGATTAMEQDAIKNK